MSPSPLIDKLMERSLTRIHTRNFQTFHFITMLSRFDAIIHRFRRHSQLYLLFRNTWEGELIYRIICAKVVNVLLYQRAFCT